jgi:hypothetical protein
VDPTAGGQYQLCLYAETPERVQFDAGIPAGEDWTSRPVGYRFDGDGETLSTVRLRRGALRSGIEAKGAGPLLDLPYLPIAAPNGITVQLHETSTGRCWGAHFPTSAITANTRGRAGSGRGVSGLLNARMN